MLQRYQLVLRTIVACIAVCAGIVPITASAQGNTPEIVYSVNRTPETVFDTTRNVNVITGEELRRTNARTLPEALMEEAGIFVQQTNYGGGAPILRGLIGKQILILIDGIKLNNATYRFGPIQYLNTIDLSMVERIEIVNGVGTVLGSDALGGAINIITKKGPGLDTDASARGLATGRYSSADDAFTAHAELFGQADKHRYFIGATFRSSSDVEGGGDIGEQAGTGYDEVAANLSYEHKLTDEKTISFRYQYLEQSEVPRTDRIANGRNLVYDFDPQTRHWATLGYQSFSDWGWSDFFEFTLSFNNQEEGRQEIRASDPTTRRENHDEQTVFGATIELGSSIGDKHRLVYGFEYFAEDIDSTAHRVNLETGATSSRRGTFTDGASYDTWALYAQDRIQVTDAFGVTIGARYNSYSSSGSEQSSLGTLDLDTDTSELTGAIDLGYLITDNVKLVAGYTRGFRGPNLEDISVYDERSSGTEVPNSDVGAEQIESYQAGIKYSSDKLTGSLFYHHSDFSDLLERAPGTLNGLSFFDLDGDGIQDPGEPNVLLRQNIGSSEIHGYELDFRYLITPQWTLKGNYTYTEGTDSDDVPLRRIPPKFGTVSLGWNPPSKNAPWINVVYHFAADQRRLAPGDIDDSRIGPDGTDGFNVLHLRGGLTLGQRLDLTVAIENIFDEEYKYHSSGVYRPGRQIVFGVQSVF